MLELVQTLDGHTDRVWTLAWNASGTILASSGSDKTIRLWTENAGSIWECKSILTNTHSKSIRRLCWSPCGNYLASASFDSTVCISKRNAIDNSWSTVVNLEGHESEVKSIAWSHDGKFLASCGRDRTIWIWERATNLSELESEEDEIDDAENWDCSDVKNDHSKDVKHIVWHPQHNILVSTSYDDTIKMFHKDGEDWKCFNTLTAHTSTVWSADFSNTGEYLVTCSDDKTVRIWKNQAHKALPNVQSNSWKCTSVIQGYHSRPIYYVSWCQKSDVIASASGDNSIAIYTRETDNTQGDDLFVCVQRFQQAHNRDVNALAWNPKSCGLLASGGDDRSVKIWKFSNNVPQGMKPITVVDEIMKNLSETTLDGCPSTMTIDSSDLIPKDKTADTCMTFNVNNHAKLFNIIQNLQTLQSEIYLDTEKQRLIKLLDLKITSQNLPPVRLSGLRFDSTSDTTTGFYVDIIDNTDQIKYKFNFIITKDDENFELMLPRRSVKLVTVGGEFFLFEKTGDLYKILTNGHSEFLLGHLFSFSDVQFALDGEGAKVQFIISADRDEKLRITNYPNTFEIERYCFGHKNFLSRIFIANENKFVSIDQNGDICVWDLDDLSSKDRCKPLTPIRTISTSNETVKKRLCVG